MIIDTHAHVQDIGYPAGSSVIIPAEAMVDAMDQFGIEKMWISPCSAMVLDFQEFNRRQYERYKKRYPDRFVSYAIFNPYRTADMRDEFRRCFEEYGVQAIKVHSWMQGFILHQPVVYEIMETAARYGVPVMFHDGTPPYADTSQIAALAERFPEVRVILGHAGLYDSYRAAIDACNTLDNVWLCLLGNIVADAGEIVRTARHDRLLFGSDYCFGTDEPAARTLIADRLEIVKLACPEQALLARILYDNAKRLIL